MSVTRLARVVTPERDEKQYRRCRLSNGLEVLLISDATLCGADDDGAGAGASEDDGSASEDASGMDHDEDTDGEEEEGDDDEDEVDTVSRFLHHCFLCSFSSHGSDGTK